MYALLADLVALLHAAIALYIVLGLVGIAYGLWKGRRWARNLPFRATHLGAGVTVLAFEALNQPCPFTTLERYLRAQAGEVVYQGSFIAHYVSEILHVDVEPRALALPTGAWVLAIVVLYVAAGPRRGADGQNETAEPVSDGSAAS